MQKTTIYSLSKELGMTPSMVSRAFNPKAKIAKEKRELVLSTAKKYNFSPNKFASRLSMKAIKIGILLYYKSEPLKEQMVLGLEDAYDKIKDYKIEYMLKCIDSREKTPEDCYSVLMEFSDYDGVIISGLSKDSFKSEIDAFTEKNPNLVFLQSVCENTDYLFASKHDEALASKLACEIIADRLYHSKRKNVLLFTGDMAGSVHKRAKKAFISACKEHSLNLIDCIDMHDSEEMLSILSKDVLYKYQNEFDGIYITSGNCISLCEEIKKQNIKTTLVTFDVFSKLYPYIEDKTVCATIFQNITAQASTAFSLLCDYLINNKKSEKTVYTPVSPVFKSTLGLYK